MTSMEYELVIDVRLVLIIQIDTVQVVGLIRKTKMVEMIAIWLEIRLTLVKSIYNQKSLISKLMSFLKIKVRLSKVPTSLRNRLRNRTKTHLMNMNPISIKNNPT